jgi:hypothetical protein
VAARAAAARAVSGTSRGGSRGRQQLAEQLEQPQPLVDSRRVEQPRGQQPQPLEREPQRLAQLRHALAFTDPALTVPS